MRSFQSDLHMVIDASIQVTHHLATDVADTTVETLYPPRHKITLPLNGINNVFEHCETSFNYHTKLDCDR